MTTRWEEKADQITRRLRAAEAERHAQAAAQLALHLERLNDDLARGQVPSTAAPVHPAPAVPVRLDAWRRSAAKSASIAARAAAGASGGSGPARTAVTAAPTLPRRAAAWEDGRRRLDERLQTIVASAPAVWTPPPPAAPVPTVTVFAPLPTPPPRARPARRRQNPKPKPKPTPEMWSPTPVLGFRAWKVTPHRLEGVYKPWTSPTYAAGCVTYGGKETRSSRVPHSNGECGTPPCGIYAVKEMDYLLNHLRQTGELNSWLAFGLVELTGKVVEHQLGYRGAKAKAVAIVADIGGWLCHFAGPEQVAAVFANPHQAARDLDRTDRAPLYLGAHARDYLDEVRLVHEATRGLG